MSDELPKKKVFMYGQWVEVTVLPPTPAPDPDVTAHPTGKTHLASMDSTAYDTQVSRRARKKPTLH